MFSLFRSNSAGEREFIQTVLDIERHGSPAIKACLSTLDVIDSKSASLLQFIGLMVVGLLFVVGAHGSPSLGIISNALLSVVVSVIALLSSLLLVIAAIFCLRCLYIIGPQNSWTKVPSGTDDQRDVQETLEAKIVSVADSRRRHYLAAYWVTVSATTMLILMIAIALISKAV